MGLPATDTLFVMGFSNDPAGVLSPVTVSRIEAAVRRHRQAPGLKVIATGGHGDNFNRAPLPHRTYVNAALAARGVPPADLEPDGFLSANTVEDAMMIAAYATTRDLRRFEVATSAFHLPRCRLIFGCVAPGRDIVFHAAADPPDTADLVAHEERARARILAQGGVIWDSRLYACPSARG